MFAQRFSFMFEIKQMKQNGEAMKVLEKYCLYSYTNYEELFKVGDNEQLLEANIDDEQSFDVIFT